MTAPGVLADDILMTARVLQRGAESVRAVMSNEVNRFSSALDALRSLATAERIPIAIIGGLGAIRYGYPAATQDIDVAVGRGDLDRFMNAATQYGLTIAWEASSGWHTLMHGDVEINIVPEGGKARNTAPTTIPGPIALGVNEGLEYASLAGWLELKLSSARQKDRAHIVEVLKKTPEAQIDTARERIAQVNDGYAALFDDLLAEARKEREQEHERGSSR